MSEGENFLGELASWVGSELRTPQNRSSAVMQQRQEPMDSLDDLCIFSGNGRNGQPGKALERLTRPNQNGSRKDHVMGREALHLAEASRQEIQEIWKPVEDWPGYEVSDHGRVRSWKRPASGRVWAVDYTRPPRNLKQDVRNGYPSVVLCDKDAGRKWASVHRLVLSAFCGPAPDGYHGAHGNGDTQDNRLSNLRWASPADNNADKARHGTRQNGERAGTAKLTWEDVAKIRERRSGGEPVWMIADEFGVCRNTVTNITTGRTWVAQNGTE